jgi:hypothetical protein
MNKEQILKRIGQIIDDLKEQHNYLISSQDLNLMEMELFAANSDFLNDHIAILKKFQTPIDTLTKEEFVEIQPKNSIIENTVDEVFDTEENEVTKSFLTPSAEPKNIELETKGVEMMFEFEQNLNVDEIFDRELTDEETRVLKDKQVAFSKLIEVNQSTKPDNINEDTLIVDTNSNPTLPKDEVLIQKVELSLPIVPEKDIMESIVVNETESDIVEVELPTQNVEEKKQTLNDLLSNHSNVQNISSRLSNMTTQDLKSSISLNDKMIFIKELFNGYNLAYSEALEILNRFESFEAADNFLHKNYAQKNKWIDKQEVVDRFYELLNRRYLK